MSRLRLLAVTPKRARALAPNGPSAAVSPGALRTALVSALLLLLLLAMSFPRPASAGQMVHAREVSPGVWFVQGEAALGSSANHNFISNAAFVVTGDGVLVVDALGSPSLADELMDEIARVTDKPVRYLVVTHYHADHIYGLQAFKARHPSVRILAHEQNREYLNSETAARRLESSREDLFPWIDENTRLVAADEWLDGDRDITLGDERFRLRHLGPAHTPGDLVVFSERSRALFVGDLVFRGRIPFVGQADSSHWITALEQLIAFQPVLMVPGHGAESTHPLEDLTLTLDYLRHLRQSMGEAVKNLDSFDEAYDRTDWSRFERLPLFREANRINAYNTYLLMEQESQRR